MNAVVRPALVIGLGAMLALAMLAWPPQGASGQTDTEPWVTAAVQVTQNTTPTRAHTSAQLARNPVNGELVTIDSEVRHDLGCHVNISMDDGRRWFRGGDPHMDPWTQCSGKPINGPYATMEFDDEGVLYVAFYANAPEFADDEMQPLHVFLARSTDGGRTFETNFVHQAPEPVTENEGLHNNDRPMVEVDKSNPDNVYVGWMQRGAEGEPGGKTMLAASTDGGRTFGEPVDLSDERGGYQPRLAVTPDGVLHAIYPIGLDARPEDVGPFEVVRTLYHRRSEDQGQTWSERVEVEQGNSGFYGGRKWLLEADRNDGTLYAVWYGHPEEHFDPTEEPVDVFLRRSTDGGQTWSDRVQVNDPAPDDARINRYDPGIGIAPNGRVDIAWYDFRHSPYPERIPEEFSPPFNHDGFQDVYYSWSTDSGQTFSDDVRVTDRTINREIGLWSNNVHSHMSVGLASTDDAVFFAWQDTRNGNYNNEAEDTYFASAWHEGMPASAVGAAGDAGLAGWLLGLAGLVLGAGLAMVVAALVSRRSQASEPT